MHYNIHQVCIAVNIFSMHNIYTAKKSGSLSRKRSRKAQLSKSGAGKTLAAILASRVVNAKLTLVIALNNTLEGWRKEIEKSFPTCRVFLKKMRHQLSSSEPTYLILNYEAFQQKDSKDYVEWLVENHSIDFVVLSLNKFF